MGGVITGDDKDALSLDVTPLSLVSKQWVESLPKPLSTGNTMIPTSPNHKSSTAADNQPAVDNPCSFKVERPMAADALDASTDRYPVAAPRGIPQIEVTFGH